MIEIIKNEETGKYSIRIVKNGEWISSLVAQDEDNVNGIIRAFIKKTGLRGCRNCGGYY